MARNADLLRANEASLLIREPDGSTQASIYLLNRVARLSGLRVHNKVDDRVIP